jgi:hypothetical protein
LSTFGFDGVALKATAAIKIATLKTKTIVFFISNLLGKKSGEPQEGGSARLIFTSMKKVLHFLLE